MSSGADKQPFSILFMGIPLMVLCSVFFLPPAERFFPLSRYAMFANPRPDLEPLPYAEVELVNGQRRRVPIEAWSMGGMSNGRNQLQALPSRSSVERERFCRHIGSLVDVWLNQRSEKGEKLWIMGGRFRREDVLQTGSIEPLHSQPIHSCRLQPVREKQ